MEQVIRWKPTAKQRLAFNLLQDKTTTELLYGGAAGGGKTYLGCVWITFSCLKYPGSRWLIGRAVLKHLKSSTLLTLFEVLKAWGLKANEDYFYSPIDGTVRIFDSTVHLRELGFDPSDPEFDKLGSSEYTGGFIDECSQISTKAKNIVMSRIRYKLDEYGIVPKLLMCSNPTKNFLYYDFYKPWHSKELPEYRKFVPALVTDNPYISPHYIENLKKMDKVSKERLLFGNWDYDDDPSRLFDFDSLTGVFTNDFVKDRNRTAERFLSVDAARLGGDRITFFVWKGLWIEAIYAFKNKRITFIEEKIEELRNKYAIPLRNVVVDEDGVGGGVVDHLRGVTGFVNGSRPYPLESVGDRKPVTYNYGNLKAQCYYALADAVNADLVGCYKDVPVEYKTMLIEDLEQVKRKDADRDGKIYITAKKDVKESLGRSPDFGDAMMMRMVFSFAPKPSYFIGGASGSLR